MVINKSTLAATLALTGYLGLQAMNPTYSIATTNSNSKSISHYVSDEGKLEKIVYKKEFSEQEYMPNLSNKISEETFKENGFEYKQQVFIEGNIRLLKISYNGKSFLYTLQEKTKEGFIKKIYLNKEGFKFESIDMNEIKFPEWIKK